MRKIQQIAAIALLVFLAALAAVTVQVYRHGRDRSRLLEAQGLNERAVNDSFRNTADALHNLQTHALTYLLTGQADSLQAYRESLQDWQYESATLNLLAGDLDRRTVARFAETGSQLVGEMGAIVSLDLAGSRDAALQRLRTGTVTAYRDKIKGIQRDDRVLNWERGRAFVDMIGDLHRLIYCAGGLCLLGFSGLSLLLYNLGTKPRCRGETGSEPAPAAVSN